MAPSKRLPVQARSDHPPPNAAHRRGDPKGPLPVAPTRDREVADLPPRAALSKDLVPHPVHRQVGANIANALALVHAATHDCELVDVPPALAVASRGIELSLVTVGHFTRAPKYAVDTARRAIEALAERDGVDRATPWQRALMTIFRAAYAQCGGGGPERDLHKAVVEILELLRQQCVGAVPSQFVDASREHIRAAVAALGRIKRIVYPETNASHAAGERHRNTPGRGSVTPYGAMIRFADAFGLTVALPRTASEMKRAKTKRRQSRFPPSKTARRP